MKQAKVLAQDIMDLYYQRFKEENEDFFDLEYFIRHVGDAYSYLLREEYKAIYASLRGENRHKVEIVVFDTQWLKKETLEIKKDEESGYFYVDLKGEVFSFPFDQSNCGLQNVEPVKRGGCLLIRSSINEKVSDRFLPETEVTFWWPEIKRVILDKNCCKKVNVFYVPAPKFDTEIADGTAEQIKGLVLKTMFDAKQGRGSIDMTNDSNPNNIPQTEVNKETLND